MGQNLKELSRGNITVKDGYNSDNIQLSCLMRIADATEVMTNNYVALQNSRDYYENLYKKANQTIRERDNTIRSLRGHITRLKNKGAADQTSDAP